MDSLLSASGNLSQNLFAPQGNMKAVPRLPTSRGVWESGRPVGMRLPWLQVDADGLTRGRLLGRLLGLHEHHGVGLTLALWSWALEMSPEGDFSGDVPGDPELLAAALSWPINEASRLMSQLQRVGLVATVPNLRVRGLDRYKRAWEKNQRRNLGNKPENDNHKYFGHRVPVTGNMSAGTGAEPAKTGAEPARKTETETETEKKEEALSSLLDPAPVSFLMVFEHWRTVMKCPKAKPVAQRRKAVAARLAEGYSIDDLKKAIDGCAKTPHNMGRNDNGSYYNDLELICRNGTKVERFMAASGATSLLKPEPRSMSL